MYQTKTVMGYGYREDFDRELTNALNKIAAEGGRNLQVSNSTYSERETDGWGGFKNSYRTRYCAIVTYEIDG